MLNAVDEWRGTTDPDLRRRVQNRLNQRAYRQRRRQMLRVPGKTSGRTANETISPAQSPWYTDPAAVVAQFRGLKLGRHAKPSPSDDHVLCIMQFNVMRAFGTITSLVGLSPTDLLEDDTPSPFSSPTRCLMRESPARHHFQQFSLLPESLSPTSLQRSTPHHPWIDILPFPQMRDNLLRLESSSSVAAEKQQYDADSLCHWMVGLDPSQKESGLILWGEPWDLAAWEVTAEFLDRWGWTLEGCVDLFRSTNYWRSKRGLKPLFTLGKMGTL
ncbi:hypothetical protein BBK36DRAFT_1195014 [Trichoderma citrinoviride]|uniref:BZIP domain-containing protein n=1 Tax=Trichoderma citrinoviride TaxID=58853 RepID=A0A2T4BFN7_9HYPO|nr:hypothetical protein BBK36DRAFT_1195014 [Trichoderma citrinoviride]PTB68150.1 hypothetical protein BBK36DRAFT_1195014 [Trichoderma citrinoviride]